MKKSLLLVLMILILVTGCGNKTENFKEIYKNMEIGKNLINGYKVDIKLSGYYGEKRVKQDIKVTNYLNKDYKVEVDKEVYYLVDGKKYNEVNNKLFDGIQMTGKNTEIEEMKSNVPFLDTEIYLNALKNAKADDDALIQEIAGKEYKVYTFMANKKSSNKLLKGTVLEDLKFKDYVPAKIWIDSDKRVHKIIYDLGASLKQDEKLIMTATYTKVGEIEKIKINNTFINGEEEFGNEE